MPKELTEYEWGNQVDYEANEARRINNKQKNNFTNQVLTLIAATQLASTSYDQIMAAEASKPIIGDLLEGVLFLVLPQLKLGKLFVSGKFKNPQSELGIKRLNKLLDNVNEKYQFYAGNTVQLTTLVKGTIATYNQSEDSKSQIQRQYKSRNEVVQKLMDVQYEILGKALVIFDGVEKDINKKELEVKNSYGKPNKVYPEVNPPILEFLKTKLKEANLEIDIDKIDEPPKVTKPGEIEPTILYNMFKYYTELYVVIIISDGTVKKFQASSYLGGAKLVDEPSSQNNLDSAARMLNRINLLPTYRHDDYIEGLSSAQRLAIYSKFNTGIPALNYPGIKDYKDLIRHWGAKLKLESTGEFLTDWH